MAGVEREREGAPCFEDPLGGRLLDTLSSRPSWPERKALVLLLLLEEVMETRSCGSVSRGSAGTGKVQLRPLCHVL